MAGTKENTISTAARVHALFRRTRRSLAWAVRPANGHRAALKGCTPSAQPVEDLCRRDDLSHMPLGVFGTVEEQAQDR